MVHKRLLSDHSFNIAVHSMVIRDSLHSLVVIAIKNAALPLSVILQLGRIAR